MPELKSKQFNLRLAETERSKLDDLAFVTDLSPSEVIRLLVVMAHENLTSDQIRQVKMRKSAAAKARKQVLKK